MSNPPHPAQVIDRVHHLQAGIRTVAIREDGLTRGLAARLAAINRELAGQLDGLDAMDRDNRAAAEAGHLAAVARLDQATAARAGNIQRAYHAAKARLAATMQDAKDQRNARIQGEAIRERLEREETLGHASGRHEQFLQTLAEEQDQRRKVRADTLASLRSFRLWLHDIFLPPKSAPAADTVARDAAGLHAESQAQLRQAGEAAAAASRRVLPRVFRVLPFWPVAAVLGVIHLVVCFSRPAIGMAALWPGLACSLGALALLWICGLLAALGSARRVGRALGASHRLGHAAAAASAANLKALAERMHREEQHHGEATRAALKESDQRFKDAISDGLHKLDRQIQRLPEQLAALHRQKAARLAAAHAAAISGLATSGPARAAHKRAADDAIAAARAETAVKLEDLAGEWRDTVLAGIVELQAMHAAALAACPAWTTGNCAAWSPPAATPDAVRIGTVSIHIGALHDPLPRGPAFALPAPPVIAAPLNLVFPDHASLMIESGAEDHPAAALAAITLRLLAAHPPGRVAFTLIDPVGLGREFAGLMHLADYEELVITNRIWTQTGQIEDRLAELNEHIEKIIQMYLRNEFANIAEYNRHAGSTAEKHRYLVIAGFPAGFSETATKRLMAIAASGARCGVHLLVHRDTRLAVVDRALADTLAAACIRLCDDGEGLVLAGAPAGAGGVAIDPAPARADATVLVHRIGRASVDSNRVELPFAICAPAPEQIWAGDAGSEIRVPIGRAGAKKLQLLALGKGTRQHMLVAGKTGSGKSTLFHVIITNLAMHFSPAELEFYLVDFKKGVEFKCYAAGQLPHARVIAIESDRGFALSVLRKIDNELKERGEIFRLAGVQDMPGYRAHPAAKPLPRCLLVIDEFQEFFTEDDAIAQEAALLLDRIVRQGRAFGIHVILGSQTLGGAYTLARATMGQMVVRVALQCNETDAHLIMDDDNPAPRLLSRPGEGIYNDQAGVFAANSPFQIAWLGESERGRILAAIHARAQATGMAGLPRVVFEGNAPADIHDNAEFTGVLHARPTRQPQVARAWLGAANAIKGPTDASFRRQGGSHLLITGQSSARTLDLMLVAARGLAAQYPPAGVAIHVLDPAASADRGQSRFALLDALLPGQLEITGISGAPALLAGLAARLAARADGRDAAGQEIYLMIHDLQRFKALRPDDDFSFSPDEATAPKASAILADILAAGGPLGLHVIAATDTWNNVSRWLPRKLLAEFGMRVLFQMGVNDSANLIDSPAAASLGPHRALFFDEHLGTTESFRPYALPEEQWFSPAGIGMATS